MHLFLQIPVIALAIVSLVKATPQQQIPYPYSPVAPQQQPYEPPYVPAADPNPPHYEYKYEVSDPVTGDQHAQQETRNDDVVDGSYSVLDPDGFLRTVIYHADDEKGFTAEVQKSPAGSAPPPPPQSQIPTNRRVRQLFVAAATPVPVSYVYPPSYVAKPPSASYYPAPVVKGSRPVSYPVSSRGVGAPSAIRAAPSHLPTPSRVSPGRARPVNVPPHYAKCNPQIQKCFVA